MVLSEVELAMRLVPSLTDELRFASARSVADRVPLLDLLSERLELSLFPNDDLLAAKRV